MENIFTSIYERMTWGNNKNPQYKGSSGEGSSVEYNIDSYVRFLRKFITDNHIEKVVDLGCGDFVCGPYIYNDLNVTYKGYDAYKKVVDYNATQHPKDKFEFIHLDFYTKKEEIQGGDLCILKDVLQHWPLDSIYQFLDYLVASQKFKFILLCNCRKQAADNTDVNTGGFRKLSCDYLPLKKYNPIKLFRYKTKEVSVIVSDPQLLKTKRKYG